MENEELVQLIFHGREERNLEFKGPISWQDINIKAKITKSVLAMANIKDGGVIIIGVEQDGEKFIPVGLNEKTLNSYKQDDVSSFINEFADPFIEIKISHVIHENKRFVLIQVNEFQELPVVCKKDGLNKLRRGAIYTRPRRKIESVEVPSQVEMREILDIASEKSIRSFRKKLFTIGFVEKEPEGRSDKKFNYQLDGL